MITGSGPGYRRGAPSVPCRVGVVLRANPWERGSRTGEDCAASPGVPIGQQQVLWPGSWCSTGLGDPSGLGHQLRLLGVRRGGSYRRERPRRRPTWLPTVAGCGNGCADLLRPRMRARVLFFAWSGGFRVGSPIDDPTHLVVPERAIEFRSALGARTLRSARGRELRGTGMGRLVELDRDDVLPRMRRRPTPCVPFLKKVARPRPDPAIGLNAVRGGVRAGADLTALLLPPDTWCSTPTSMTARSSPTSPTRTPARCTTWTERSSRRPYYARDHVPRPTPPSRSSGTAGDPVVPPSSRRRPWLPCTWDMSTTRSCIWGFSGPRDPAR